MQACMRACIHTSIHPYIHTSIHPYIYTSIHPYIHTYIHPDIRTPAGRGEDTVQALQQGRGAGLEGHHGADGEAEKAALTYVCSIYNIRIWYMYDY